MTDYHFMLCIAVASEIDSTFYCVSSADLVSSYVGESEKLFFQLTFTELLDKRLILFTVSFSD